MLKARVLSFRIFTDDGKVNVRVAGGNTVKGFAENDRCIDIKLLAHRHVPRDVSSGGDRCEEDS